MSKVEVKLDKGALVDLLDETCKNEVKNLVIKCNKIPHTISTCFGLHDKKLPDYFSRNDLTYLTKQIVIDLSENEGAALKIALLTDIKKEESLIDEERKEEIQALNSMVAAQDKIIAEKDKENISLHISYKNEIESIKLKISNDKNIECNDKITGIFVEIDDFIVSLKKSYLPSSDGLNGKSQDRCKIELAQQFPKMNHKKEDGTSFSR
ncbi:MAG: hypothetical protein WC656_07965 [Sulfurimonas sp.]|jgi:hypothetical protein